MSGPRPLTVIHLMRPARPGAFSIERVCRDLRAHMPDGVEVREWVCPHPSRGVLPRLRGAWAARRLRADVLHVTGDAHYLTAFLPRARTVLTVHDCEFVTRARGPKRWLLWLFWLRLPVARAARIVTISEASRRDLLALVPVAPDRVEVIANPLSPEFRPAPPPNRARPRILQVGTKTNKNLDRLARALKGLDVDLVVVGQPNAQQRATLKASGVPFSVAERLDDAGMVAAYRDTDLLAFCSTSEGFGLPILEAQATGRPVVTSDRAPMRDVAGDGALLVDPEEPADIRRAIRRLIDEPELRADLVTRGHRNAARFGAAAAAKAHAYLYHRIADGDRP